MTTKPASPSLATDLSVPLSTAHENHNTTYISNTTPRHRNSTAEITNHGIQGYLQMRSDVPAYHRMKRYYYRLSGVVLFRYPSTDHCATSVSFEVVKVDEWDGKGIFHLYNYGFKLFTTSGTFNVEADTREDQVKWMGYIQSALHANHLAMTDFAQTLSEYPAALDLTAGGFILPKQKHKPPAFKNQAACHHPTCTIRFEASRKRPHHCRNCGSTICSEHGSTFIPLPHIGYLKTVRVCVECSRVDTFIQLLRNVTQLFITHRIHTTRLLDPTELSVENQQELSKLQLALENPEFGVSDALQALHLHRRSCDEIYQLLAEKLMILSSTSLLDFEFFLPQIFHMWATMDAVTNLTKSIMLVQVLLTAARRHLKLAQLLYWHTRAAIDDSRGIGFGQSERSIPSVLKRKFAWYKLMLINLEVLVAGTAWQFEPDEDLQATTIQVSIIRTLFSRISALQLVHSQTQRPRADTLGFLCSALLVCGMPWVKQDEARRQSSTSNESQKDKCQVGGEYRLRLAELFRTQIQFVDSLCQIAETLRHFKPTERKPELKKQLEHFQVPNLVIFPLGSCLDKPLRILNIAIKEGTVFSTKARAPTMIYFELQQSTVNYDSVLWHRQHATSLSEEEEFEEGFEKQVNKRVRQLSIRGESKLEGRPLQPASVALTERPPGSGGYRRHESLPDFEELKSIVHREMAATIMEGDAEDKTVDEEQVKEPSPAPDQDEAYWDSAALLDSLQGGGDNPVKADGGDDGEDDPAFNSIIAACETNGLLSPARKSQRRNVENYSFEELKEFGDRLKKELTPSLTKQESGTSISQSLRRRSLFDLAGASEVAYTGQQIVKWLIGNGIAMDTPHAVWIGSEMIVLGILQEVDTQTGFGNNHTLYALGSSAPQSNGTELSVESEVSSIHLNLPTFLSSLGIHSSQSKSSSSGAPDSTSSSTSQHRRLMNPFRQFLQPNSEEEKSSVRDQALSTSSLSSLPGVPPIPQHRVLSEETIEEYDSRLTSSNRLPSTSAFSTASSNGLTTGSIADEDEKITSCFEAFNPEESMGLISDLTLKAASIETSNEQNQELQTQMQQKLDALQQQLQQICEYVIYKRAQRQLAVASAFGERYDLKIQRIKQSSTYGRVNGWTCRPLIFKSNDDLRQEAFCLQLIRQFQDIFDSCGVNLRLYPYDIVATTASTGFIQVIPDACSLSDLKKRSSYTTLAQHFRKTYGGEESASYRKAMGNYVRSMAAYSLVCYLLQIKDRHNGNIMIDSEGHIVHIDFGFILGIAPGGAFSLETAPFKLTAEMVDAMGGTQAQYFKDYVVLLIQGFMALQQHADTIFMMIAIMAQDSMFPCFMNKSPRDVLHRIKASLKLQLNQRQVVQHVLNLVQRSNNSYRTRKYDQFQQLSNGILP